MIDTSTKKLDRKNTDFIGANWFVVRMKEDPIDYESAPVTTEKAFCSFSDAASYCRKLWMDKKFECDDNYLSYVDRDFYQSILDDTVITLMSFEQMLKQKTIEWFFARLHEAEKSIPVSDYPFMLTLKACTSNGLTSEFEDNVLIDSPKEFIAWVKTIARLNPNYFIQLLINPLLSFPEDSWDYEQICHIEKPLGSIILVLQKRPRDYGHNWGIKSNEVIDLVTGDDLPF